MITCSVCGAQNDDLATVCSSCKSYLQAKVDTLDLFSTMWGLFESPRRTFKRIVLARHKNYVLLLSALAGVSAAYAILWYRNLGRYFDNVLVIVGVGLVTGPLLGILVTLLISGIVRIAGNALGGKATVRNTFAVMAYSSVPVVLSLVFVFPVEVAIFGRYFFENNPPPIVINPAAYIALLGLDAIAVIWSWLLLIEGNLVCYGFSRVKSVILAIALVCLTGAGAFGLYHL